MASKWPRVARRFITVAVVMDHEWRQPADMLRPGAQGILAHRAPRDGGRIDGRHVTTPRFRASRLGRAATVKPDPSAGAPTAGEVKRRAQVALRSRSQDLFP